MIISRTPLRISFVGGGSDLDGFCAVHGGAVVSTAIDKWIRVIIAPRFEGDIRVSYSRTEIVETAAAVEHELVREALRMTGLPRGVEVVTLSDVPSRGTGLGSSSAVTVGLLNALYAYQGVYRSPLELAQEACEIEIAILGKPIGRQDQYVAAVGGFNLIEFAPNGGGVRVEPVVCPPGILTGLHASLLLFYTGRQRPADSVLGEQRAALGNGEVTRTLSALRDLAHELRERLGVGDLGGLGELLHRSWELKRSLPGGVSDSELDGWYERALATGATGGKVLGAGAGGFLLVLAPPAAQPAVRRALGDLREVPFRFAASGSQIELLNRPVSAV